VYTEILDALSELHRRRTHKGGQYVQFHGDLASASQDDLIELYTAAHCEPEKAVEKLEEFAESERRPGVRRVARQVASWERNQTGNARGDG